MSWLTIVPVFVAWSVWIWVGRHLATTKTGPLLFLVPVISGLATWLLLDETIQIGQIVGTAGVIVGLIINQLTPDAFAPQKNIQLTQPHLAATERSTPFTTCRFPSPGRCLYDLFNGNWVRRTVVLCHK